MYFSKKLTIFIASFFYFGINTNLAWGNQPSSNVVRFSIHEHHAALLRSGLAAHENGVLTKILAKLSADLGYSFEPVWRNGSATGESDLASGLAQFIIDPPKELIEKTNPNLISPTLIKGHLAVLRLANFNSSQDRYGYLQSSGNRSIALPEINSDNSLELQSFSEIHTSLLNREIDAAILPLRLAHYYLTQNGLEELIVIDRLLNQEPFTYQWVFHQDQINLKNRIDETFKSWSSPDLAHALNLSISQNINAEKQDFWKHTYQLILFITIIGMLSWIWKLKRLNISNRRRETNLLKLNKEAIKANHAKSNFLATVSHEIRTPMHAVLGVQELLLKSPSLKKDEKSLLLSAQHSASSLLELLDQILNLSKIEAGKSSIKKSPSNLTELMHHYSKPFIELAKQKGLQCEIQLDKAIAESLIIDPGIIRQILQNLLSNAIKFTTQGSIRITGQVLNNTYAEQLIQISIADTGIGMPKDEISRATKPYEQINTGNSTQSSGTGLGLSITIELLKSMSSELLIESHPGLGTTASFNLNLSRSSAKPKAINEIDHNLDKQLNPKLKNLKVLIVDDHPATLKVLEHQLQQLGLTTFCASNPVVALEISSQNEIDLLITDLSMPTLKGDELAKEIKRRLPKICTIGLTADIFAIEKFKHDKESVFNSLLIKPVTIDNLQRAIENCSPDINFKKLDEFAGTDVDTRDQILRSLLAVQVEGLEHLSSNDFLKDPSKVKALAHKIRGGAELIGAQKVIDACTKVEKASNLPNELTSNLAKAIQSSNTLISDFLSPKVLN